MWAEPEKKNLYDEAAAHILQIHSPFYMQQHTKSQTSH